MIELDSSEDTEPESSTHQQIEDSRKKRSTKEKVQPILRKSTRERKPVQREGYVSLFTIEKAEEEPDSPQEALNGSHKREWNEAMKREYKSLKYNGTWEYVTPPEGAKILMTKWVFKRKMNQEKKTTFKARLVIRGHVQEKGVD